MSALASIADIRADQIDVRLVPEADVRLAMGDQGTSRAFGEVESDHAINGDRQQSARWRPDPIRSQSPGPSP